MEAFNTIIGLIRDLAWPFVAIVALQAVFTKLDGIRRLLTAARYRDLEVVVRQGFALARAEVEVMRQKIEPDRRTDVIERRRVVELSHVDPAVAVMEIWRKVDDDVTDLIRQFGFTGKTTPPKFVRQLRRNGKLTEGEERLYGALRDIRVACVHARNANALSLAEVLEFGDFAAALILRLDELKSEPQYIAYVEPALTA